MNELQAVLSLTSELRQLQNGKLTSKQGSKLQLLQKGGQILDLIKRDPGELAFVMDCVDYTAYLQTYIDAGGSSDEAIFSEAEFLQLRQYFLKNKGEHNE